MPVLKHVRKLRDPSNDLTALPWWVMLLILSLGYGLAFWSYHQFIYTDEVLLGHYQEFASASIINELVEYQKSREWIFYLIQQILIMSKISVISVAIFTAAFFAKADVSLILVFKIVIVAEYIPFCYEIFKLWHLLMINNPGSFEALIQFAPLSLLGFVNPNPQQFWASHLLGYFNLFEAMYVFALVLLYFGCFGKTFTHCLKVIFYGYGSTLVIWLTFISIFLFHASVAS